MDACGPSAPKPRKEFEAMASGLDAMVQRASLNADRAAGLANRIFGPSAPATGQSANSVAQAQPCSVDEIGQLHQRLSREIERGAEALERLERLA